MPIKAAAKNVVAWLSIVAVLPFALCAGFGRFKGVYRFFATAFALGPGVPGSYLRVAYYHLTLTECRLSSRIEFGSYFAHPDAKVGAGVYIGSYCVLGTSAIGDGTHLAS